MKKILLVGINAKFIHSNLAIRYLKKYCESKFQKKGDFSDVGNNDKQIESRDNSNTQAYSTDSDIQLLEVSINQTTDYILDQILLSGVNFVGFSVYIWNYRMVKDLSEALKSVKPNLTVFWGGPEVSYNAYEEMESFNFVDFIIQGEGEETFYEWVSGIDLKNLKGITYRKDVKVIVNPSRLGMDMGDLPFPYDQGLHDLENRILYYETSRGCPFNCQYCLSSIEKGVRFKPLELVERDLQFFLDHKVRQVKFVDRTFNVKKAHAYGIMDYIIEHDNGSTNFHFEAAPELIDDGFIERLARGREGLFQLEIGVQSTNMETLEIIKRKNELNIISGIIPKIRALEKTHIHLDLIAGLPEETFSQFESSFNYVYDLKPDQLQLGFLKILKGAGLGDVVERYGIVYRPYPPYEVLKTNALTYDEISELKSVEEMVEIYNNSGLFRLTMDRLNLAYKKPFDMFYALGIAFDKLNMDGYSHSKQKRYDFLYHFIMDDIKDINYQDILNYRVAKISGHDKEALVFLLHLDYCFNEKPVKQLAWMKYEMPDSKTQIALLETLDNHQIWQEESSAFSTKQLARKYHMMKINDTDIVIGKQYVKYVLTQNCCEAAARGGYLLVNYNRRDFRYNSGEAVLITLV